jgi:crossover junction endodeoxyribonuclease RuvC
MTTMGIDPGLGTMGFAVVESTSEKFSCASWHDEPIPTRGKFKGFRQVPGHFYATHAYTPMPERLRDIFENTRGIIQKYRPDVVAVEQFQGVHGQGAQRNNAMIGMACGAIYSAIISCGIPVYEYPPSEIKKTVSGAGDDEKTEVMFAVEKMLEFEHSLTYYFGANAEHVGDAFAIAICHGILSGHRESMASLAKQEVELL